MLVTSVPYLLSHFGDFEASVPLGQLGFETDMNAYFAFIRQSADGAWLFYNPFTHEPHGPALFNLEWLAAGKLAGLFGSQAMAFHVQRVVGIALLCTALYAIARRLFDGRATARLVTLALLTGGGFGWWTAVRAWRRALAQIELLDLHAGVHPFLWMLLQPHFLIAQALALTCIATLLRAERSGRSSTYVFAGVACLAAGACRPFDMLYLWSASGLFVLIGLLRGEGMRKALQRSLVVFVSAPLLLYYV